MKKKQIFSWEKCITSLTAPFLCSIPSCHYESKWERRRMSTSTTTATTQTRSLISALHSLNLMITTPTPVRLPHFFDLAGWAWDLTWQHQWGGHQLSSQVNGLNGSSQVGVQPQVVWVSKAHPSPPHTQCVFVPDHPPPITLSVFPSRAPHGMYVVCMCCTWEVAWGAEGT